MIDALINRSFSPHAHGEQDNKTMDHIAERKGRTCSSSLYFSDLIRAVSCQHTVHVSVADVL